MTVIKAICNEGCGQQFEITDMPTIQLDDDIEKTYFTCPHCQHEYVAFYTDEEIRKLQVRIRRIQRRFADVAKKEAAMREQIKEKMDALRKRMDTPRSKDLGKT